MAGAPFPADGGAGRLLRDSFLQGVCVECSAAIEEQELLSWAEGRGRGSSGWGLPTGGGKEAAAGEWEPLQTQGLWELSAEG